MCAVSDVTASKDVERKRHMSAADESHSDSESALMMSRNQPIELVQLLPRPRSSAALDDLIDSSVDATGATDVGQLVTVSSTSVCSTHRHFVSALNTVTLFIYAL